MPTMEPTACFSRGAKNAKNCSVCQSTAYCGKDCQQKDWPYHRKICKEYASFIKENPRPGQNYYLVLVLLDSSKEAQFAWMQELPDQLTINGKKIFGNDSFTLDCSCVRTRTSTLLTLFYRDRFLTDGSNPNVCVAALTGCESQREWRGTIVVAAADKKGEEIDFKVSDLSTLITYLKPSDTKAKQAEQSSNPSSIFEALQYMSLGANAAPSQRVKCVKISCRGDKDFLGKQKYCGVNVSFDDSIFKSTKPTQVSVAMSLPLLVEKSRNSHVGYVDPSWAAVCGEIWKVDSNPDMNRTAVFLNIKVDPKDTNWGFADTKELDMPYTVKVARQDKKDITPHQVEALAIFCCFEIIEAMRPIREDVEYRLWEEGSLDDTGAIKEKEKFLKDFVCKAQFEKFLEKLKERVEAGDKS